MRTRRTKRCRRLLAIALTAALVLGAAPTAALAAEPVPQPQVWNFNDNTGFIGTEVADRKEGSVTLNASIGSGKLTVSGTHTGNQAAQTYATLYEDLSIPVTGDTRLSYHIVPQQPGSGYDYDCYSMHVAVDLRFSDGTYLSNLEVEDQNRVLMEPNSQGEAKAMVYGQDNLITVNVGEQAGLAGKTITGVLVGYANRGGLKAGGGNYKAELDDIRIEAVHPVYDTLADYVNILRGTNNLGGTSRTISRGLTGPMVAVPHGFNFWAPENNAGDDIFVYNTGTISAIRCSHEPSVWVGERGRWTFMVDNGKTGNPKYAPETLVTNAHYFSADFTSGKGEGTRLEMTPTDHGVAARFTYAPGLAKRGVVLGQLSSLSVDQGKASFTARAPSGNNGLPSAYVYGEFDRPVETYASSTFTFTESGSGNTVVTMRLATSFISADQAKANFDQELGKATFDETMAAAKKLWNDKLNVVEIEGASEEQMISFYSNMYRLFLYPNNMGEKTGAGSQGGWQYMSPYTKKVEDGKLYYNNGFWDTYRTTWAAYSLLTPNQNSEMLEGLLRHFRDSDWIPRWIAPAGTNSMVGTSSDVIFGDALMRGAALSNEQWATAYKAALKNAATVGAGASGGRDSMGSAVFLGYTPGTGNEKMSWAIEGYINDAGIANMAKALGDKDGYEYYKSRATNYVYLFDSSGEKWFRGKNANGSFDSGAVDPISWGNAYTETNAWNMAFSTPQDGQGLVNLYGGQEALAAKLDKFFSTPGDFRAGGYGSTIHEMREAQEVKLGQYGHSNQPSHHIPYMYLYAGRPDRTQEVVRAVLRQCYVGSRIGQGYIGDEDNGEMSAWYIFSALGFYPLNMGSGELVFGSPLFTKATIHHENGHDLIISAPNNSRDNIYVDGLTINGAAYDSTSILQTDLTDRLKSENVTLVFDMQSTPSSWGKNSPPPSITEGDQVADPLQDRTAANVTVLTEKPTQAVTTASAYSAEGTIKNLFDNSSSTSVTLTPVNGKASVYYYFPAPTAVSLYTLTSGQDRTKAPADFALYGSDDGEKWTELDARSGISFDWKTYTRPFLSQMPSFLQFTQFRLDLKSAIPVELAELELMGRTAPELNKDFLNELIAYAEDQKEALTAAGHTRLAGLLDEAITTAQVIANDEEAATESVKAACVELTSATSAITSLTSLWTKLAEAKSIDTAKLPTAVKKTLSAAIASAETATEDGTVATMQAAMAGLREAIEMLNTSKTLDENLTKAAALAETLEQPALKNLLNTAIAEAKALRDNENATLPEFTKAANDLAAAIANIPGLTTLWTKLAEARAIDTTGKNEVLVDYLNEAIEQASAVISDENATIETLTAALTSLNQAIKNMSLTKIRAGYSQIEALSYDADLGIVKDPGNIGGVNPGEWTRYDGVNFDGNGPGKFTVEYSAATDGGGKIAVILDDLNNTPIATVDVPVTGNWSTWKQATGEITVPVSGIHNVFMYFIGGGQSHVANVKWLRFDEINTGSIAGTVDASALGSGAPTLNTLTAKLYNTKAPANAPASAQVDADGRFSFTELVGSTYEVVLEGLSADFAPVRERVTVGKTEVPLTLILKKDVVVTATVADWTYNEKPSAPEYAVTDAENGNWTLIYTGRGATRYEPSTDVPTEAGDYTFTATYEGAAFHGSGAANFTIKKADRILTLGAWENFVLLPDAVTAQIVAATETDADESAVILYASSDDSVAMVDENGLVTALKNGKAELTVSIPATNNYNAVVSEPLPIRVVIQPLTSVAVAAIGKPDVMELIATVEDMTISLAGFITAGTHFTLTPACPAEALVGVQVTAGLAEDGAQIDVVIKDGETEIKTYAYAIDYSGIVELPEKVRVEQTKPMVDAGDTGISTSILESTEIHGLAAAMPTAVAEEAAVLLTDALKEDGYDMVTVQVYPRIKAVHYDNGVTGHKMVLDITPVYVVYVQKGDDLDTRQILKEATEETQLTTAVTMTVALPMDFPIENLYVRHTHDGKADFIPFTADENSISFAVSAFSEFEIFSDNRSVTLDLIHSGGATERKTYTVADLGKSLPTDVRSGYTFIGWSIGGAVYSKVTESLLNMGGTVTAESSFVQNSGGGNGGSAATMYTIRASAGEGGSISPEGQIRVYKNSDKIFTMLAEEGYRLADVLVDGKSVGAVAKYTFESIAANHQIEARFEKMARPVTPLPYVDVRETDWFYPAVRFVTDRDLFQGTGADSFGPAGDMTRAMLVTVLARLDGQDTAGGETWYSKAVAWGVENGITDGANAEMSITRESLVVMLYRYAKAQPSDGTALRAFPDAGQVSAWAGDAMSWAVANGILTGNGRGELNPGGTASRAEVAVILQRFLSL